MNAKAYEKQTTFYNSSIIEYGNGEVEVTVYDNPVMRHSNGGIKYQTQLHSEENGIKFVSDCPFGVFKAEIDENTDLGDWLEKDNKRKEQARVKNMYQSKKKVQRIAKSLKWEWFFTFTFDPTITDSFDYDECQRKISKWLNNARRKCPNMAYLVVPEQHKSGRWHFHALMSFVDNLTMLPSGHYTKKHQEIYNCPNWSYGFTTCIKCDGSNATANYICKYFTKEMLLGLFRKRKYKKSQNLPPTIKSTFMERFNITTIPVIMASFGADEVVQLKTKDECYNPKVSYILERSIS